MLRPANEYVREFVQHMNPLNVLRGRTFMCRSTGCAQRDGWAVLDPHWPVLMRANGGGIAGQRNDRRRHGRGASPR